MAENEKLEGIQMEELEALAGEFTLDDLAQYDNELEFDVTDLESIKPVYSKKEKRRLIFMSNKVTSIIKWCFAGLGLIGLVMFILAMVSPDVSEALSTTVTKAVVGALATVSNLLPISLFEILVIAVVVGILAYIGFLVYKTIKEKEGIKIVGIWMQLVYSLLAVAGVGFLLFSICYGVTIYRPYLYQDHFKESYAPLQFTEQTMGSSLIYYSDKINEVSVNGMANIYYTADGSSQYATEGASFEEIGKAVNDCFDLAAAEYPVLSGSDIVVKEMVASPLYSMMGVGSMYCPFTGEILINTDYPELIAPMQIARTIAKQRGIADDGDASFVAYLVCTKYADQLAQSGNGNNYNLDFIKYAAYMDAYMEIGSVAYQVNADIHLYCTAALKENAKRDMVAYVKALDALYGNTADLEFIAAQQMTPANDYLELPKLLYLDFNKKVEAGEILLSYNTQDTPVPVNSTTYYYMRYLVTDFATHERDWSAAAQELYAEKNQPPMPNNGKPGSYNPLPTDDATVSETETDAAA